MRITRNEKTKTISYWLTNEEHRDPAFMESLKPLYKQNKADGYMSVVYRSGKEDLYDNTLALLKHNRTLSARKEVEAEKARQAASQSAQTPTKPERERVSVEVETEAQIEKKNQERAKVAEKKRHSARTAPGSHRKRLSCRCHKHCV